MLFPLHVVTLCFCMYYLKLMSTIAPVNFQINMLVQNTLPIDADVATEVPVLLTPDDILLDP